MLVGAKVSRLLPFLQSRGFIAEAFARGGEAQARLRTAPCHVLILELELGDMLGVELGRAARQDRQAGAVMLMDDPAKSGMVVSALARGLETFVPIPPDESAFLERIELLLLAQWGLVVTQQQAQILEDLSRAKEAASAAEEKLALAENAASEQAAKVKKEADERIAWLEGQLRDAKKQADEARASVDGAVDKTRAALQAEVADERKKVEQLRRETAVLRDQLTSMHLVTGAKSGVSEEGAPTPAESDADALDDALLAGGALDGDDEELATAQFELPTKAATTSPQRPGAKAGVASPDVARRAAPPAAGGFDAPRRPTTPTTGLLRASVPAGAPTGSAAAAPPTSPTTPPTSVATTSRTPAPVDRQTAARGFALAAPTAPATASLRTTPSAGLRPSSGAPAGGDDEFDPATLGGAHAGRAQGAAPSFDDRTAPFPKEQLAAGVGSDLEPPTLQSRPRAGSAGRVPSPIFDEADEATVARAPAGPPLAKGASFKANDEDTAPGGHASSQIKSQLAAEEKHKVLQKEQARAAAPNRPGALFNSLGDLPSLDEEVLFLEDE